MIVREGILTDIDIKELSRKQFVNNELIKEIPDTCFYNWKNIKTIIIPKSVEIIGAEAFAGCITLKKVELPQNLTTLSDSVFYGCSNLKKIIIPSKIKRLERLTFAKCFTLRSVEFPKGLEYIGNSCFYECQDLKEIEIPSSVKVISNSAFKFCTGIKKITFNEGLEVIEGDAFAFINAKEIKIPQSVSLIEKEAFYWCASLEKFEVYSNTIIEYQRLAISNVVDLVIINPVTGEKRLIKIDKNTQFIKYKSTCVFDGKKFYFFDDNNEWKEININDLNNDVFTSHNINDYMKFYEWSKRDKFLPNHLVIKNMPIIDIDDFYVNGNCKRYKDLLLNINLENDTSYIGFFKLCYVLGLFNNKGNVSKRAYEFIKSEFINDENLNNYCLNFSDFDIEKEGYNKDFEAMLIKGYKDLDKERINEVVSLYNKFENIKNIYPNKKIKSNRRSDILTLNMCLDAIANKTYQSIHQGNEEFASNISMYGHTQQEFERAQKLFEMGKSIPSDEITLLIAKDNSNEMITYELLDKDNPLGVVVGDITNCCQTLSGAAKDCLAYGLSKRNSKFMIFVFDGRIIGQSWVWYDEIKKKICLDNIEVPKIVIDENLKNNIFKEAFINCLKRSVKGFLSAMNSKGLEVKSITIGEGHNDINDLLKEFELLKNQPGLTKYNGYSDADNQYVLYKRR